MALNCYGVGRMVSDAEIRYTGGEKPLCIAHCRMAFEKPYKKNRADGEPTADFVSCVAFGHVAEFLEKFGKKGTKFMSQGIWQTGSYEKDGSKYYTNEFNITSLEFVESKSQGGTSTVTSESAPDGIMADLGVDIDLPFV